MSGTGLDLEIFIFKMRATKSGDNSGQNLDGGAEVQAGQGSKSNRSAYLGQRFGANTMSSISENLGKVESPGQRREAKEQAESTELQVTTTEGQNEI